MISVLGIEVRGGILGSFSSPFGTGGEVGGDRYSAKFSGPYSDRDGTRPFDLFSYDTEGYRVRVGVKNRRLVSVCNQEAEINLVEVLSYLADWKKS